MNVRIEMKVTNETRQDVFVSTGRAPKGRGCDQCGTVKAVYVIADTTGDAPDELVTCLNCLVTGMVAVSTSRYDGITIRPTFGPDADLTEE